MKLDDICWSAVRAGVAVMILASTPGYAADTPSAEDEERARRTEYIQKALKGEASPVPGKRMVSAGTGFYVAPQRILTNGHVVEGCAALTLRGADGRTIVAAMVTQDKAQDLALMSAESAQPVSVATFRASVVYTAGDIINTIGYPDQGLPRIEPFLTKGLILGPENRDGRPSRFAIRADIRQGNSGGPVFDSRGTIIGIINARIDTVSVYKKTGRSVDKVGFAIANGPIFDFLARHGVKPAIDDSRTMTPEPDLLAKVKPFTVRVSCWR